MANYGIIGVSGFVGQHLAFELRKRGHYVRSLVRTTGSAPEDTEEVVLGDFTQSPDWASALQGLDTVFLLAARVHVMHETAADPLAEFRRMNVQVAMDVANGAISASVPRLVFLSSIKVNGEETLPGRPFTASDSPNPQDPYGISKREAEDLLLEMHESGSLEVAILRSPLVYGPGVRGNFLKIMGLVDKGLPLPFGSTRNRRAMISVGNLSDALITVAQSQRGDRMVALVKNAVSPSTGELLHMLARGLGRPSRVMPFPLGVLSRILTLVGRGDEASRLLESLDVEISATWPEFQWMPMIPTSEGIEAVTRWYRESLAGNRHKSNVGMGGSKRTELHGERRRTVWIFEHHAVPPGVPGLSRQYDHARYIGCRGWDTRIFASSFGHKSLRYERKTGFFTRFSDHTEGEIDFTWVYTTPYSDNNWKRYVNMVSYLFVSVFSALRRPKPDIVIGASPHLFTGLAAWTVSRRYRVPFVFEVQDLWPESLLHLGLSNRLIIWFLKYVEHFLYHHADAIITLSNGATDGVRSRLEKDVPLVLVPTGADLVVPISSEQRMKQRRGRGWEGKFVAIWAGAHGPANHLDTIVEAARISSSTVGAESLHWVLVGDGSEKERLIQEARGLLNIEFLPPVPSSEISAILQLADVGVIVYADNPVFRGTRPTKLAEYMAVGLPVVSNLQGEGASLIAEAGAGRTVPIMRPDLLANEVWNASNHPEETRLLGESGKVFVQEQYTKPVMAEKLAHLLDEIVENSVGSETRYET